MYPKLSAMLPTTLPEALHAKSPQRDHLNLGALFIVNI